MERRGSFAEGKGEQRFLLHELTLLVKAHVETVFKRSLANQFLLAGAASLSRSQDCFPVTQRERGATHAVASPRAGQAMGPSQTSRPGSCGPAQDQPSELKMLNAHSLQKYWELTSQTERVPSRVLGEKGKHSLCCSGRCRTQGMGWLRLQPSCWTCTR